MGISRFQTQWQRPMDSEWTSVRDRWSWLAKMIGPTISTQYWKRVEKIPSMTVIFFFHFFFSLSLFFFPFVESSILYFFLWSSRRYIHFFSNCFEIPKWNLYTFLDLQNDVHVGLDLAYIESYWIYILSVLCLGLWQHIFFAHLVELIKIKNTYCINIIRSTLGNITKN